MNSVSCEHSVGKEYKDRQSQDSTTTTTKKEEREIYILLTVPNSRKNAFRRFS